MSKRSGNSGFRPQACLLAAALLITPCMVGATDMEQGFDKVLNLQGIVFHVTCPNDSSLSDVTIVAKGLDVDTSITQTGVDGTVTGAEVADLNRDGSPEIYVYVTSVGSGSYGSRHHVVGNGMKRVGGNIEFDKIN